MSSSTFASTATSIAQELQPDKKIVYKSVQHIDESKSDESKTELKLHLFNPPNHLAGSKAGLKAPAIVFFFGGGWNSGTPRQFYQQSQYLAQRGVVCLCAEYRVKQTHGTSPYECVADGKSAVRWIRSHADELGVDPDRIVAAGGSAGGHVAACTGLIQGFDESEEEANISSVPNAMILFNPVLDTTESGFGSGRFEKDRQTELSPADHVRNGIPPTLLFHGTSDKTVPFENASRFTNLMHEAGNICQLESFENQGHGFFNGPEFRKTETAQANFQQTMDSAVTFLKELGYPLKEVAEVDADSQSPQLPNVLLILADDLGYGDLRCYNAESRIATPNLDQLARQGIRFTDAHSPCTVCTPTRYSLMTGSMAFRIPNGGKVFTGAGGPSLIAPTQLTLPKMLKSKGYATACFGKWHIGMTFYDAAGQPINNDGLEAVRRIDFSRAITGGPLDCGFDHFFGTACCPTTDWLYAYVDGDKVPNPPTQVLDRSRLPDHPYSKDNRPGMQAADFDLEDVDLVFLKKSQQFLRQHVQENPQQPFFLFHSMQTVHLPSFPAKEFQGKTDSGPHGDFIFEMDQIVGRLLETLEELNVADNTLVIFTSDNGPEVPTVIHMREDYQHDGAKPWRGMKRDNWEGGHRVPFIARWPSKINPKSISNQMTSLTDVFATIADIIATPIPSDAAVDSFSMLPALTGADTAPIRPYILQQGFGGKRYLAIRAGKWKYLDHQGSGGNNYDNHPGLRKYLLPELLPDAPGQLYDLETDPAETSNLSQQYPEKVSELKDLLQKSIADGRSTTEK